MPKSDREKIRLVPQIIKELQEEFGGNAPKDILLNELSDKYNMDEEKAEELITKLKRQGSIYEPKQGYYKVV